MLSGGSCHVSRKNKIIKKTVKYSYGIDCKTPAHCGHAYAVVVNKLTRQGAVLHLRDCRLALRGAGAGEPPAGPVPDGAALEAARRGSLTEKLRPPLPHLLLPLPAAAVRLRGGSEPRKKHYNSNFVYVVPVPRGVEPSSLGHVRGVYPCVPMTRVTGNLKFLGACEKYSLCHKNGIGRRGIGQ
eukprot:1182105-Prorocentrum_minimum.AAC.2